MKIGNKLSFQFLLLLIINTVSTAQVAVNNSLTISDYFKLRKDSAEEKTVDPSGSSNAVSFTNFINLKSTFGDESAEIKIDFLKTDNVVLGLKLSTPVGKDDKEVKPFTLADGLAGSTSLELNFGITCWHPNQANITSITDSFRTRHNIAPNIPVRFYDILMDTLSQQYVNDREIIRKAFRTPIYFTMKPAIGRPEFSYVTDTVTFDINNETKTDFAISTSISILPNWKRASMFAVAVSFQSKYEASASSNSYNIPSTGGTFVNKEFFIGEPELKSEVTVSAEFRTILSKKYKIGLRPNINVLTIDEVASLEVPIYYYGPKSDGGDFINGGIYIGYKTNSKYEFDTKKDNILLGVFISKELGSLF